MHAVILAAFVVLVVNLLMVVLPLSRWIAGVLFLVAGCVFYAATKDIYAGMTVSGAANIINVMLTYFATVTHTKSDGLTLKPTKVSRIPTL